MSMLLPSKKRGHGNGDKNKHDKTIQEWRLVCGYNSVGLGSRVSSSSEWFQSTYIPLNVYGNLRMETDTLLKINGQTANIQQ
jgi:hypothetical protein